MRLIDLETKETYLYMYAIDQVSRSIANEATSYAIEAGSVITDNVFTRPATTQISLYIGDKEYQTDTVVDTAVKTLKNIKNVDLERLKFQAETVLGINNTNFNRKYGSTKLESVRNVLNYLSAVNSPKNSASKLLTLTNDELGRFGLPSCVLLNFSENMGDDAHPNQTNFILTFRQIWIADDFLKINTNDKKNGVNNVKGVKRAL